MRAIWRPLRWNRHEYVVATSPRFEANRFATPPRHERFERTGIDHEFAGLATLRIVTSTYVVPVLAFLLVYVLFYEYDHSHDYGHI